MIILILYKCYQWGVGRNIEMPVRQVNRGRNSELVIRNNIVVHNYEPVGEKRTVTNST